MATICIISYRSSVDMSYTGYNKRVYKLMFSCDYSSPRDRADSELTDATTDPQIDQSDDDQLEDSPRDASNASSTEAQELRLQLTELRELLAQKVLLINELQGLCRFVVLNSQYSIAFYYHKRRKMLLTLFC